MRNRFPLKYDHQLQAIALYADINECTAGTYTCPTNTGCVNTIGSYTCQCVAGYEASGNICVGK